MLRWKWGWTHYPSQATNSWFYHHFCWSIPTILPFFLKPFVGFLNWALVHPFPQDFPWYTNNFLGPFMDPPHLTRRGDAKFATCHIRSSSSPLGRRCLRCKLSFDSVRMIGAETIISQNADNIDKSGFTSLWSAQLWTKHRGNLKPWDLQNLYMANFRYSAKE